MGDREPKDLDKSVERLGSREEDRSKEKEEMSSELVQDCIFRYYDERKK